jgi:hypothetical protein
LVWIVGNRDSQPWSRLPDDWAFVVNSYIDSRYPRIAALPEPIAPAPPLNALDKPIHHAVESILPNKPKPELPPAPVVEVAPSFGDLQSRALGLADALDRVAQQRLDKETQYPQPMTVASLNEWKQSNDVVFQYFDFLRKVKSLQDEFAELHFRDDALDQMVSRYEEDIARRNSEPEQFWWSTYIDPSDMQYWASRIRVLASKLPR